MIDKVESNSITTVISTTAADQLSRHLANAEEYFSRAMELIEVDQDWRTSGLMIRSLKHLPKKGSLKTQVFS